MTNTHQPPLALESFRQDWSLYSFLNTDMCRRQESRISEREGGKVFTRRQLCRKCMLSECIFNRNLSLTSVMGRYFNDWTIVVANQESRYNQAERARCKDKWDSTMLRKW